MYSHTDRLAHWPYRDKHNTSEQIQFMYINTWTLHIRAGLIDRFHLLFVVVAEVDFQLKWKRRRVWVLT